MAQLTENEREFVRSYTMRMIIMAILATAAFFGVLVPTYLGKLSIGKASAPLDNVTDRWIYTLKHLSLQLAWIIISMYCVIYHRLGTPALDPSKGYETLVQNSKNILTNSIEHGLVFIISQLIMVIDLSPDLCRRLIPTMNVLYIIGRIFYLFGYPKNRSFGFVIANFSIVAIVTYNMYQLVLLYLS